MDEDLTRRSRALAATAMSQHGVFNLTQVLAAGYTMDSVKHKLRRGEWERLLPSTYRIAGAPPSREQNIAASVAWAELGSASHEPTAAAWGSTAAWLMRFEKFDERAIHICSCRYKNGFGLTLSDGTPVAVHRVDQNRFEEVLRVAGIPTTSVRHTIMALCGNKHPRSGRVLDDALFKGLVSLAEMWFLFEEEWTRGRRGIAILRDLLLHRTQETAPTQSDLEDLLVSIVSRFNLLHPSRQWPLQVSGKEIRLDFAYPTAMIALETDGYAWHRDKDAFETDRRRDLDLVALGWIVVRFTWAMLKFEQAKVAAIIQGQLDARTASSAQPSGLFPPD